jgi:Uma2 family endonuclease
MAQTTTLPPLVRGQWIPMTSEEFDAWVPEGMQAEWVDGKGMIFVSTSTLHGRLSDYLADLLRRYVLLFDLGEVYTAPVELRLPPRGERREPDVFVVLTPDLGRVRRMWVDGPAALVVEFVSEHSVREDRVVKLQAYAAAGVREYLIVDAREERVGVDFYRLNAVGACERIEPDAEGRYHSEVLPGFWLDPAWLRQDPLPVVEDLLLEIAPEAYERWLLERIRARRSAPETS